MGHDVTKYLTCNKIGWNHPLYNSKRKVWNAHVNRYPAAIFECRSVADVQEAIRYAKENGLKVTVRGGGFHQAGKSVRNNAVLIDMSYMNNIHIDEISKIATVGAGAKSYEVDEATQAYGLAVPLGMLSQIGVAGLALGGGIGYLRGKYGLTSDNIVSVDLVTGTGELINVNQFEHPELFWAIRGSGIIFGVVTKFEFKLHQVGPYVLSLDVVYDFKDLPKIIKNIERYRKNAIDDISFHLSITNTGGPKVRLIGMYEGQFNIPIEEEIIQPLLELANPVEDNTEIMTFVELQRKYDNLVRDGFSIEGISLFFNELRQEVITLLMDEFSKTDLSVTMHLLEMHGKVNRIPQYATAFTVRDAKYLLIIDVDIDENEADVNKWLQMMYEKILPYSYQKISYLNSSQETEAIIKNSYQCIYHHLMKLKQEYDPEYLFCPEYNILE